MYYTRLTAATSRTCKVCKEVKPFNANAKRNSKESKFYGIICWACHIEKARNYQNTRITEQVQLRKEWKAAMCQANPNLDYITK